MITLVGLATGKADVLGEYGAVKALEGLRGWRTGGGGKGAKEWSTGSRGPRRLHGAGGRSGVLPRSRLETKCPEARRKESRETRELGWSAPRMLMVAECGVQR